MKRLRNKTLWVALTLFGIAGQNLTAQNLEEFEAYLELQRQEFAQYKADRESEFNRFREQNNREFAYYLRKAWKQVTPEEECDVPREPKPFIPKRTVDEIKYLPDTPQFLPVLDVSSPKTQQKAAKPIEIEAPSGYASQKLVRVNFYGNAITLRCSDKVDYALSDNSQSAVASAWERLAVKDLDPLIYDCQQTRERLKFCDWMYYQFVKEVAHIITKTISDSNEETLLTGYILAQSGIDFRYVRVDNSLLLALPFDTKIYGYRFFPIGSLNFYIMNKDVRGTCYLMDKSFSKEATCLTLRISSPLTFTGSKGETRMLTSKMFPELKVELSGNQFQLDFYQNYPRMDWQEYSLVPMSRETVKTLADAFKPHIEGKSEELVVNMILNFVQTAFTYGYDNEIWGTDRPFFAEETLFYPYSDCEDRAILFSQLIRELTKQDVVLLHYPNHLATAVYFNNDLQGDYVIVDGKKYLVCDPTGYRPAGNAYDEFKNVKAKVIKIQ